jgi:hypothetical protein
MQRGSWAGASGLGLLLAACGGGGLQSTPASQAVTLASAADALRELGNTAAAVRLLQTPIPGPCSSGNDAVTGPASKSRSFVYFSGVTETVVYQSNDYLNCGQTGGTTLSGFLEDGASSDSSYTYAVYGSESEVLLVDSSATNSSGVAVTVAQNLVGTIETNIVSSTQSEIRSGMETTTQQAPQSGGAPTYNASFSVGVPSPAFDLVSDSGSGTETITGGYAYSSSSCSGGSVTVATPTALQLTVDGSNSYATGGVLTLTSGSATVTYTFSASGAALSGSISGSLSTSQVQQAFSAGSGC